MNADSNPYATPVDTKHGKYDHSLFWRIVKACAVMAALAFLADGILLCFGNLSSTTADPIEILSSQLDHENFRRNSDWWPTSEPQ